MARAGSAIEDRSDRLNLWITWPGSGSQKDRVGPNGSMVYSRDCVCGVFPMAFFAPWQLLALAVTVNRLYQGVDHRREAHPQCRTVYSEYIWKIQ